MGRWMDGKTAKRREREKNFVRRKQASFEREKERGAPLFEIAGWQNANYLALFPACKDACKKGATPLSFHIHTFPPPPSLRLPLVLTEMRFDPVSTSSVFLSLCFVHFFVFFFFFLLFRQAPLNKIFLYFRWLSLRERFRGSLRPNFWIREVGACLRLGNL